MIERTSPCEGYARAGEITTTGCAFLLWGNVRGAAYIRPAADAAGPERPALPTERPGRTPGAGRRGRPPEHPPAASLPGSLQRLQWR